MDHTNPDDIQIDAVVKSNGNLGGLDNQVAAIVLKGDPYNRELPTGEVIDCTTTLNHLVENTNYAERLDEALDNAAEHLEPLKQGGYYAIDAKIKAGEALTYDEAYSLATFVSMGVNRLVLERLAKQVGVGDMSPETVLLQSIALLSAMSAKEGYVGLQADEIAGMVAATLEIDTILRVPAADGTIAMGGMGGDRGYVSEDRKSKPFSLSTMSALVLSALSTVHKHHSYPNTSVVAGQGAIEAFGARSDQNSMEALLALQNDTGLLMSSCHTLRLLHTLSHRLKGETVNHVIGPLAIPMSADALATGFFGVNHNVHPQTIVEALQLMHMHGAQNYGNAVAFCGLNIPAVEDGQILNPDIYYANRGLKGLVAIDEVAPPPYMTLASFLVPGQDPASFLIEAEDILPQEYLSEVALHKLVVANTQESILGANEAALTGNDLPRSIYLAMSAGLALFTKEYAHLEGALDLRTHRVNREMLQEAFSRCFAVIASGDAFARLGRYVERSQAAISLNR